MRLRALPSCIGAVADASIYGQLTAREAPGVIAPSISYPAADERSLRQHEPRAEERSADLIAIGWHDVDIRRQWASNLGFGGLIAGSILLSPVFAFLMALAVEILIGLARDGGRACAPSARRRWCYWRVLVTRAEDAPAR
jgi:hypothetical protein